MTARPPDRSRLPCSDRPFAAHSRAHRPAKRAQHSMQLPAGAKRTPRAGCRQSMSRAAQARRARPPLSGASSCTPHTKSAGPWTGKPARGYHRYDRAHAEVQPSGMPPKPGSAAVRRAGGRHQAQRQQRLQHLQEARREARVGELCRLPARVGGHGVSAIIFIVYECRSQFYLAGRRWFHGHGRRVSSEHHTWAASGPCSDPGRGTRRHMATAGLQGRRDWRVFAVRQRAPHNRCSDPAGAQGRGAHRRAAAARRRRDTWSIASTSVMAAANSSSLVHR